MQELTTIAGVAPRSVEAGQGVTWWSDAWALFMKAPGMWILFGVIFFVITIVLHFIPLLGWLISPLLTPVLLGGWMLSARKLEHGGSLELVDMFDGFKDKITPLMMLGVAVLLSFVVIGIVMGLFGVGAIASLAWGGSHEGAAGVLAALGSALVAILIALLISFFVSTLLWFAPPLVVFDNVSPVDAMKASFAASMKNIVPFLLFGILYLVLAIVAMIPFGLGWLVLGPVGFLTMYTSYRSVFNR